MACPLRDVALPDPSPHLGVRGTAAQTEAGERGGSGDVRGRLSSSPTPTCNPRTLSWENTHVSTLALRGVSPQRGEGYRCAGVWGCGCATCVRVWALCMHVCECTQPKCACVGVYIKYAHAHVEMHMRTHGRCGMFAHTGLHWHLGIRNGHVWACGHVRPCLCMCVCDCDSVCCTR